MEVFPLCELNVHLRRPRPRSETLQCRHGEPAYRWLAAAFLPGVAIHQLPFSFLCWVPTYQVTHPMVLKGRPVLLCESPDAVIVYCHAPGAGYRVMGRE